MDSGNFMNMLVAVVVISIVVVGLNSFYVGMLENYNVDSSLTQEKKDIIMRINQTSRVTQDIVDPLKSNIEHTQVDPLGVATFFLTAVVAAVRFLIQTPTIIIGTISNILLLFEGMLPPDMVNSVYVIVSVIVAFSIISIIMKWRA